MDRYSHVSEQELISHLKLGDIQAFDELYWKYQKAVYQNIFKLIKDSDATEDILQEVFIGLWEKKDNIDPDRSVGGWLFVSSYNRSINALKKKLRESLALKNFQQQEISATDEQDISDLQLQVLEKAMDQLSPQKRRVFELCKMKGKSYEETASEMHISKHTVKEYLSEANSFIRDYVRQNPELKISVVALFFFACSMNKM